MLYQLNYRPIYQTAADGGSINELFYLCFFVQDFLATERAVFIFLKLTLNVLAVFCSGVILALALRALKGDDVNRGLFFAGHFIYS